MNHDPTDIGSHIALWASLGAGILAQIALTAYTYGKLAQKADDHDRRLSSVEVDVKDILKGNA